MDPKFVAAYAHWLGVTEGEAYMLLEQEPLTDITDEDVTAAGFEESEHPRHPAGSEEGGEFAAKGGTALAEASPWDDVPGYAKVQQEMADSIVATGQPTARLRKHFDDLSLFPDGVLGALGDKGVRIYVGNGSLPDQDDMGFMKGVRPRGWPEGSTWDDVPGGYQPAFKEVALGDEGNDGSQSLALHETAHAVGDLFGIASSKELKDWHEELYRQLGPYEQQGGPRGQAGREEMFAEAVAASLLERDGQYGPGPFRSEEAAHSPRAKEFYEWVDGKLAEVARQGH
jgi:hypothetical protein